MKRALPLALLGLAACRGFDAPRADQVEEFLRRHPAPPGPYVRLKVRMSIDAPSLSGVFEGVVLAKTGPSPAVRAQFFPDLGGKALDLLARPDRITGYFPMAGEGVDIALPGEARLHPLSLIGVTMLEHAAPLTPGRVLGVGADGGGVRYRVAAVVPGVSLALDDRDGSVERRFSWKYGASWREEATADRVKIESPKMTLSLDVLAVERPDSVAPALFELRLPPDVRR